MSRRVVLTRVIVLALGAATLAGCGGTGVASPASVDLAKGKQLFVSTCGSCHTLAAAGTAGKVGPNLDGAYAADRLENYKSSSFEAMVREQIDLADPPMPRHLLKGADAADVAAYVAKVAGAGLAKDYQTSTAPK